MHRMFSRLLSTALFTLLAVSGFAQTDTSVGCQAPKSARRNVQALAHYLTDDLGTERQKANAIYNWITHNIRYDYAKAVSGKLHHDKLPTVLRKRRGVCEGYADLFTALCREAGLNAVTIEGYSRDWTFDDSDQLYVPRHAWNAVMIDRQWELVDATWGAGGVEQKPGWLRQQMNKVSKNKVMYSGRMRFAFHYDTAYFLTSPAAFRLTHLPADPLWQLTDSAMPAQVFSAGTAAASRFNEQYSRRATDTKVLAMAAGLPDVIRIYEYSDRAHTYNPNFSIPLAMKGQIDAEVELSDTLNARHPMPLDFRTGHAITALNGAKAAVKAQQSGYDAEYRDLKRKNKRKNALARQQIRELRSDNKRLIAQCESKARSAEHKAGQLARQLRKEAAPAAINKPGVTDQQRVVIAKDSATARIHRIAALDAESIAAGEAAESYNLQNRKRLDSMSEGLVLSDSLLVQEALARIHMRDSYDEEVIGCSNRFRRAKYAATDSMHGRYQQAYDSSIAAYARRQRIDASRLMLIKSSLRELSRYGSNSETADQYTSLNSDYTAALATRDQHTTEYRGAIKTHVVVLNALAKMYRRQDKLADYMEQAEKKRQELEEKVLVKKADFNKRENDQREAEIEKAEARVKRMGARGNV